ncbi:type VI secretion system baseplate subunit TssG [Vibrio sp. SCSIO 43136]|uniref:type VI secretion system baseplate subunit TssG n=1 Tax=Vibrio sp. SCSIO 43136 TaxID=2819101 RepID=UPI002075031E|nr:type VI secretion system baseplate subunit TssG [Vibrio sp. SCSIO 43136]USD66347.1 type VI secretion system baseplate subunit TssG [Vibrio sp. SCSIO 43136]
MSLTSALTTQSSRFEFIQVIRLLRALGHGAPQLSAELVPYGAPDEVQTLEAQGEEIKLRVGLEALSGAKGMIPDYLYAELLQALHQEEFALADFIDVFNHRYLELKAAVESSANVLLRQEREKLGQQTRAKFSQWQAIALMGALPRANEPIESLSQLRFGMALASKQRNLNGLKNLLTQYFGLDVTPQVNHSAIYRIPTKYQTRIGHQLGKNHRLGDGVMAGKRGEQVLKTLDIQITPRSRKEYLALVDDLTLAQAMRSLVHNYLRDNLEIKVYLRVKREFLDKPILSSHQSTFRLGEANCLAPERNAAQFRKILLHSEKQYGKRKAG